MKGWRLDGDGRRDGPDTGLASWALAGAFVVLVAVILVGALALLGGVEPSTYELQRRALGL